MRFRAKGFRVLFAASLVIWGGLVSNEVIVPVLQAEKQHVKLLGSVKQASVDADNTLQFLPPHLGDLVEMWNDYSISTQQARKKLWKIVSSRGYTDHRLSRGIIFVKTHKTGSSTLTSVIHSLATAHNLTAPVVDQIHWLPWQDPILKLQTTNFSIQSAPYDVWCNHVVFDNLLIDKVVPNGKVLSIVRDPATRIRSACGYYGCCPSDYKNTSVWDKFVLSETGRIFFAATRKGNATKPKGCEVDQSSKEIVGTGLDPEKSFQDNFDQVIDRAKTGDFLLLVTERMIESMLAFWYDYQLHPLDVAFLSKKVRKPLKESDKAVETLQAERLMREWNPYDTMIHQVADELLTDKMQSIFPDPQLRDEAQEQLLSLNDLLYHVCADEGSGVPQLNYWCREKELDNVEWNRVHLEMLRAHGR